MLITLKSTIFSSLWIFLVYSDNSRADTLACCEPTIELTYVLDFKIMGNLGLVFMLNIRKDKKSEAYKFRFELS